MLMLSHFFSKWVHCRVFPTRGPWDVGGHAHAKIRKPPTFAWANAWAFILNSPRICIYFKKSPRICPPDIKIAHAVKPHMLAWSPKNVPYHLHTNTRCGRIFVFPLFYVLYKSVCFIHGCVCVERLIFNIDDHIFSKIAKNPTHLPTRR